MRAAIAYYMMILYCTVISKPLILIVKDKLSHTFAEAIHIATIHAFYGANHLQKEIDQTSTDATNDKHQHNNNAEQVYVSANEFKFDFCNAIIHKIYFISSQKEIIINFISKHFPPPKFY